MERQPLDLKRTVPPQFLKYMAGQNNSRVYVSMLLQLICVKLNALSILYGFLHTWYTTQYSYIQYAKQYMTVLYNYNMCIHFVLNSLCKDIIIMITCMDILDITAC